MAIDETRKACKKEPTTFGFNPSENAYEPLKLMQSVVAKVNEICLRYTDNSVLCSLPPPGPPYPIVSVYAVKNRRKKMEDRHVVIPDLNTIFNRQEASPSGYYAIFDGHAGHQAAAYSSTHLHQFLAESKHFVLDPEQAFIDAFSKTDSLFVNKCNVEGFSSGTTAVCALHRPKEKTLWIAWVGDSQALLVKQGHVLQCVTPHKPSRGDEKERIEREGGYVSFFGTWRVNGMLAVSRAIGDPDYKPCVTASPEIREIHLDGGEDFLILGCDGLWDHVSEDVAATAVYEIVCDYPEKVEGISRHLAHIAKEEGSLDNISTIVVFLREPTIIAAEAQCRAARTMDAASLENANNPFFSTTTTTGNPEDLLSSSPKTRDATADLLLNLSQDHFKHPEQNGNNTNNDDLFGHVPQNNIAGDTNKKCIDADDLGPETDVDALDDVISPSIVAAKAMAEGIINSNPEGSFNPFVIQHELEKAALETDLEHLDDKEEDKENHEARVESDRSPRGETPTAPAETVVQDDNLAYSGGEDSEDEWDYIKGEAADNKENVSPAVPATNKSPSEVVATSLAPPTGNLTVLEEDDDAMSQLNPDAAEFVPESPTSGGGASSPPLTWQTRLTDDVIAQSPQRPVEIDSHVPKDLHDFEEEIKFRPSDCGEEGVTTGYSNGHPEEDHDNIEPVTSPKHKEEDLMENLLNGKSIDEIPEFHPGGDSSPSKVPSSDEFHFGPNAAPFTPSKGLLQGEPCPDTPASNRAVYGDADDSQITLDSRIEDDPMSTSFYQEKDNSSGDSFDLNKVRALPNNLEEFLGNKEEEEEEQQIDVPLSLPNNDDVIVQTTDLDKVVEKNGNDIHSHNDDEKELESPVSEVSLVSEESSRQNLEDFLSGHGNVTVEPVVETLPDVCLRPDPVIVPVSSSEPVAELGDLLLEPAATRITDEVVESDIVVIPDSPVDEGITSSVKDATPLIQSPMPIEEVPVEIPIPNVVVEPAPIVPEVVVEDTVKPVVQQPTKTAAEPKATRASAPTKKTTTPHPVPPKTTTGAAKKSSSAPAAKTVAPPSGRVAPPQARTPATRPAVPKATTAPLKSPVAPRPLPRATGTTLTKKAPIANGTGPATKTTTTAAARTARAATAPTRPPITRPTTAAAPTRPVTASTRPITAPTKAARPTTAPARPAVAPAPRPTARPAAAVSAAPRPATLHKAPVPRAAPPARVSAPRTATRPPVTDAGKPKVPAAPQRTAVTSTVTSTKVGTTRTTVTKTTIHARTGTLDTKRKEVSPRPGVKTTKTTKIEKPTQNGVSTTVTEQIELVHTNDVAELVKDNSPIDNKLLNNIAH